MVQVAACGRTTFLASLQSREIKSDWLPGREKRVAGVRPICLDNQTISHTDACQDPHKHMMGSSRSLAPCGGVLRVRCQLHPSAQQG